jgi:uncharacterized membrane protein
MKTEVPLRPVGTLMGEPTMRALINPARHNVNLWIVPLKMSLTSVLLFAVTVTLDTLAAYHVIHIPTWFTMGGIDDARAILGAMLGCVSTVLALIFSVALLVLSMVANLFGPRLLYRFVQDWVTQVCIGLFMGAFIYVFLVFLVTHQDEHSSFIPQVSLITSWFVVLGAFSFLVFYSHRVAELIQNPDAIGRIVDDLRVVAAHLPPVIENTGLEQRDALSLLDNDGTLVPVFSAVSGYLQLIDHRALVEAAAQLQTLIRVPFRPGQFVLEGEAIAYVPIAIASTGLPAKIQNSLKLGRHRVLYQDIEFGIAQIVEIAIRALSPAINDTFTGVACVDLLGEAITILAAAPRAEGRWHDASGVLRLQIRPLLLSRLIKQAFDQIRQAAADNPAVSIRMLSTLGRLGAKMHRTDERNALREQAASVWETANAKAPIAMDRDDLEAAWLKAGLLLADENHKRIEA